MKKTARFVFGIAMALSLVVTYPTAALAFDFMDVVDPWGIIHDDDEGSSQTPVRNPLIVSCSANKQSADTGDNVTWTASVSGGNGNYKYTWSGSENLNGGTRSVTKTYTTEGYKDAFVKVVAGLKTKKVQCNTSPFIDEDNNDDDDDNDDDEDLRVSCYPSDTTIDEGDSVTWRSRVTGGGGDYSYDWEGDEDLSGSNSSVTKRYNDTGTMQASLTVESDDGDEETVDCDDDVRVRNDNDNDDDDNDNDDDIGGTCYATPGYADVNESVIWRVSAWGGDGDYDYDWSGSEGLDGSGSSVSKRYYSTGMKNASVRVESDGDSKNIRCESDVEVSGDNVYNPNPTSGQLSVTCSPNTTSTRVGSNVTWSANVFGGNGNYTYSWIGTDGITSSGSTMSGLYDGPGTKYAYVTVRSGGKTAVQACGAVNVSNVTYTPPPARPNGPTGGSSSPLEAVCYANTDQARKGESVLWTVEANGGTGTYTYSWMGADNLKGAQSVIVKNYKEDGGKFAVVTVKSGSQSVTQACDSVVEIGNASAFGAAALFGIGGISWGFIGFLIVLLLILVIAYVLYNRSKI